MATPGVRGWCAWSTQPPRGPSPELLLSPGGRAGPRWRPWVAARGVRAARGPHGRGPRSSPPGARGGARTQKPPNPRPWRDRAPRGPGLRSGEAVSSPSGTGTRRLVVLGECGCGDVATWSWSHSRGGARRAWGRGDWGGAGPWRARPGGRRCEAGEPSRKSEAPASGWSSRLGE